MFFFVVCVFVINRFSRDVVQKTNNHRAKTQTSQTYKHPPKKGSQSQPAIVFIVFVKSTNISQTPHQQGRSSCANQRFKMCIVSLRRTAGKGLKYLPLHCQCPFLHRWRRIAQRSRNGRQPNRCPLPKPRQPTRVRSPNGSGSHFHRYYGCNTPTSGSAHSTWHFG